MYLLNYHIHSAINLANLSIWKWEKDKSVRPVCSYMGYQDNCKVFRIVYPKTFIMKFYYQIILYIDKDTKYLKHLEVDAFNNDPGDNFHKVSLKFDCELYTGKKPAKAAIYLPVNIEYNYKVINVSEWDLKISDIRII